MTTIARNISDSTGLMITLITNAPINTNGMRRTSRRNILSAFWQFITSPVSRVTSDEPPKRSVTDSGSLVMCAKVAARSRVPKPNATFDARYCPVAEIRNPPTASAAITEQYFIIYVSSPAATPTSMTFAIIIGTASSAIASMSLHSGAAIAEGI